MRIANVPFVRRCAQSFFVLLIFAAISGCGGSRKTGTVTGTVTYQGVKLGGAKVAFYGPDDQMVSTSTDSDGNYKAQNVPVGQVYVSVSGSRPAPSPEKVSTNPIFKKKGYVPSAEKKIAVPPQYGDPQKSNISLTVNEGTQPFDIELR